MTTPDNDLVERMVRVETKVDALLEGDRAVRVDHEARLRRVEKWMYMLPPTAVVALLAAASERGLI
jgi:hypothetical protein